jgi:hypothetical protein
MPGKDHWGRIMRFRSFLSAVALAAFVVGAGSANAAVIINGDFEAVQLGSPYYSSTPADIPGWFRGGPPGDAFIWNTNFSDSVGSAHAGSGNQFITIGNGFEIPGGPTAFWTTTISDLIVGQKYALTFMIAYESNADQFRSCGLTLVSCVPIAPTPQTVWASVAFDAFGIYTTGTPNTPYWGTWQNEKLIFVASATSEGMTFSSTSSFDVGLDNVQIGAVPELSTWAMMLLGFAGIGLVAHRRKKTALQTA